MRIVLSGGGTGGHVFPLIALAAELKRNADKELSILFIGQNGSLEEKEAKTLGLKFWPLVRQSNRRGFPGILISLALAFLGILQSIYFLLRFSPDVVVGGGGYVSLPAIAASVLLRKPFVILEQNMIPGKITRLFSRWARMVFLAFPGSEKHLSGNFKVVGNPIREDLLLPKSEARKLLQVPDDAFLIVVAGGSKGARSLNLHLAGIVPELIKMFPQLLVFWLTGEAHHQEVLKRIPDNLERLIAVPFDFRAPQWISAADLYIGRAGAGFLWEVLSSGVPSILIPYPYAADGHQIANARFLETSGASLMILEEDRKTLKSKIEELILSPQLLSRMGENARILGRKSAAQEIASYLKETWKK